MRDAAMVSHLGRNARKKIAQLTRGGIFGLESAIMWGILVKPYDFPNGGQ
jgi:hypothetical protein